MNVIHKPHLRNNEISMISGVPCNSLVAPQCLNNLSATMSEILPLEQWFFPLWQHTSFGEHFRISWEFLQIAPLVLISLYWESLTLTKPLLLLSVFFILMLERENVTVLISNSFDYLLLSKHYDNHLISHVIELITISNLLHKLPTITRT